MKCVIAGVALWLLASLAAVADEPATGFWVVGVERLQAAVQEYGAIDKIDDTTMSMLCECSGHFSGTNLQFQLQSDSMSFDMRARESGTVLDYSAVLGWGKIKRSALQFQGKVVITDAWSFPDEWETRKHVIVFKRLNMKK